MSKTIKLIRVGLIVHTFDQGGIERSIVRTVDALDRTRFQPVIICISRTGTASEWLSTNTPIIELNKKPGLDFTAIWRLIHTLRREDIDVVHSHNWGTLIEAVLAIPWTGVQKHIHAERGTVLGTLRTTGFRFFLRSVVARVLLKRVDLLISNSSSVASKVQAHCGYLKRRIVIVPNGVPELEENALKESRRRIRDQIGVSSESILIGSVGRLANVKGFMYLVEAFSRLVAEGFDVHLVIVGEGPEEKSLFDLADKLQLGNQVHMVGKKASAVPWYAAMDVYVNSSISEGMSQSIVEAMAAGLPIIATDVGESRAILEDGAVSAGVTCESQSIESLANALREMLGNSTLRDDFGAQSRAIHARKFSLERFTRTMESLYSIQ